MGVGGAPVPVRPGQWLRAWLMAQGEGLPVVLAPYHADVSSRFSLLVHPATAGRFALDPGLAESHSERRARCCAHCTAPPIPVVPGCSGFCHASFLPPAARSSLLGTCDSRGGCAQAPVGRRYGAPPRPSDPPPHVARPGTVHPNFRPYIQTELVAECGRDRLWPSIPEGPGSRARRQDCPSSRRACPALRSNSSRCSGLAVEGARQRPQGTLPTAQDEVQRSYSGPSSAAEMGAIGRAGHGLYQPPNDNS